LCYEELGALFYRVAAAQCSNLSVKIVAKTEAMAAN